MYIYLLKFFAFFAVRYTNITQTYIPPIHAMSVTQLHARNHTHAHAHSLSSFIRHDEYDTMPPNNTDFNLTQLYRLRTLSAATIYVYTASQSFLLIDRSVYCIHCTIHTDTYTGKCAQLLTRHLTYSNHSTYCCGVCMVPVQSIQS